MWQETRHAAARRTLERYCAADVVALQLLAAELLAAHGCAVAAPDAAALWQAVHAHLPPPAEPVPVMRAAAPAAYPHPPLGAVPPADAIAAAAHAALTRAEKQKRLRELWRGMRSKS